MNSPLLLVATLLGMLAAAWALIRRSPVVASLASAPPGRYSTLDGLRGLLACGVLTHHAYIARATYFGEPWNSPASPLYHFAGDAAVALFFMITGLLFWDKALARQLRFGPLMRSRLRRIVPLQTFCGLLVIALCTARAGDTPFDPLADVDGVLRWLGHGLLGEARIHGVPTLLVDAGVTWSLTIEWLFYLALLPLAGLCGTPRRFALLAATTLLAAFVSRRTGHFVAQGWLLLLSTFGGGMLAAHVARAGGGPAMHPWARSGMVSLAIVATAATLAATYHLGNPRMLNLLLVPAFVAIALGNDLFTLLRRRSLRWLGHISFSVYLLHGIVLVHALRLVDRVWPIAQWSDGAYVALTTAIGVAVVGLASTTYLLIERAFVDPRPAPRWVARLRGVLPALPHRAAG